MITKEKHPMRVLFFRDHEMSGLRAAAAGAVGYIVAEQRSTGKRSTSG
jgi:hypothetical protein